MLADRTTTERVVIVGGGMSGLSIACRLIQSGLPVTVLEASRLGFAASTRNQGWLHSGAWFAPQHVELARMCNDSRKQTVRFCPDCIDPGADRMAYLISKADSKRSVWTNTWDEAGIEYDDWPLADLFEQIPGLSRSKVQQAFRLPDCSFRPDVLVAQLAATAQNAGGEIRTDTPVSQLAMESGKVHGVVLGTGEEIKARLVILAANAAGAALWPNTGNAPAGVQTEYTRVLLKSHLLALSPEVCRIPFCVVDEGGFNHIPHDRSSVFGCDRWQVVSQPNDQSVEQGEIDRVWSSLGEWFAELSPSDYEVTEWAGTTVQAMHVEQIEPGNAPLPTVIDHQDDSPAVANLLSVFPGRATLWPQLAELTRTAVFAKLQSHAPPIVQPPWVR